MPTMLIEAQTIDELQVVLDALWPGKKAGLSDKVFDTFFATEADPRDTARQFARKVQCAMWYEREDETIWFEKWHSPHAA
jgi:hypothetical protein